MGAAWAYSTCGIAGGKLFCWGTNGEGQLGSGGTTSYEAPHQVGTLSNWSIVSQGGQDSCAINTSGQLYCWGVNAGGEDGVNTTTENNSPVQVGTATDWTAIAIGTPDACGIAGGSLYCWGLNDDPSATAYGSYGSGNGDEDGDGFGNTTQYLTPTLVDSTHTWTAVSGTWDDDTSGIANDTVYANGGNYLGQNGQGGASPVTMTAVTLPGSGPLGLTCATSCANPTGSEADIMYNSAYHYYQACNGTQWLPMGPTGTSGSGCSNPTGNEADMMYNSATNVMQYCNSSAWVSIGY